MKNVTILHTTSDTANFALGAVASVIGIAAALIAKKRSEKFVVETWLGIDFPPKH